MNIESILRDLSEYYQAVQEALNEPLSTIQENEKDTEFITRMTMARDMSLELSELVNRISYMDEEMHKHLDIGWKELEINATMKRRQ